VRGVFFVLCPCCCALVSATARLHVCLKKWLPLVTSCEQQVASKSLHCSACVKVTYCGTGTTPPLQLQCKVRLATPRQRQIDLQTTAMHHHLHRCLMLDAHRHTVASHTHRHTVASPCSGPDHSSSASDERLSHNGKVKLRKRWHSWHSRRRQVPKLRKFPDVSNVYLCWSLRRCTIVF
jgi:hypothetical protein